MPELNRKLSPSSLLVVFLTKLFWYLNMMKWYENHRHNWGYCHDLRFWIAFYFLCGWEAVEYGEIPPFCVYAICPMHEMDR